MNNIDRKRNVSVYQIVYLLKPFKKTHKNENNEKNSPINPLMTLTN